MAFDSRPDLDAAERDFAREHGLWNRPAAEIRARMLEMPDPPKNALEAVAWIHDQLRQALDQVVCQGVEMERIEVGTSIFGALGISVDGLQVFCVKAGKWSTKWTKDWADQVLVLTCAHEVQEMAPIMNMSTDELTAALAARFEAHLRAQGRARELAGWPALRMDPDYEPSGKWGAMGHNNPLGNRVAIALGNRIVLTSNAFPLPDHAPPSIADRLYEQAQIARARFDMAGLRRSSLCAACQRDPDPRGPSACHECRRLAWLGRGA